MLQNNYFMHINTQAPKLIAGPCAAESFKQLKETAIDLKNRGCNWFRAGVWKPRTRPGGFEGIGAPAIQWLMEICKETGMKVGCEVANYRQCKLAMDASLDFIWIGARTTSDPFAVQEIADCLMEDNNNTIVNPTVIIKNPSAVDYDLWLGAIERIYNAGITNIVACFRGFKTYNSKSKYRNEPIWDVLLRLRTEHPEIPVIVDPSHIAGSRELIPEIIEAAKYEYGIDNFMIESHCNPSEALTDAKQQFTPKDMFDMLDGFDDNVTIPEQEENLNPIPSLRDKIDEIDFKLVDLLYERMCVCKEIGKYKKEHGKVIYDGNRWNELLSKLLNHGIEISENDESLFYLINKIWSEIHSVSISEQMNVK